VLAALASDGMGDVNQAHLSVLQYPGPDGRRPSELPARGHMSKQALNYLLGQLEKLGYLERRSAGSAGRRIRMTERGWRAFHTIRAEMRRVESEWSARLGERRYRDFLAALRVIAEEGRAPEAID
jgi:DNA-binding MarR family transcriptional regulator